MTELLYPESLKPQKNWRIKYGYPVLITFLIIALGLVIYLLYQEYYSPTYKLTDLLPQDYAIAFEFEINEDSLPKIQSREILNNPTLQNIYQKSITDIDNYLSVLPITWQNVIKRTDHGLAFFSDNQNFGMIIKLADKKMVEDINDTAAEDYYYRIIQKQILLISNSQELLDTMINQKISPLSPFNITISLSPWLTIHLNDSFFNQAFDNKLLTDFQAILQPLQLKNQQDYTLKFLAKPHQLILKLTPLKPEVDAEQSYLDSYLNYLPGEYDLIFGVSDLQQLSAQMQTNKNLQDFFQNADYLLWLKSQISLSRLIKELQGPVLLAVSGNKWQILTASSNQELLDGYLRSYLAQFTPTRQPMALPDGTKAIELIADLASVVWEITQNNDWQVFSHLHPQIESQIGYSLNNALMIISNKIGDFENLGLNLDCNLANISEILSFYPSQTELLNIDSKLQNFSKITAISSTNGQIMVCLNLN